MTEGQIAIDRGKATIESEGQISERDRKHVTEGQTTI